MSVKGFHIGGQTQQYNYPNLDNTPTIPTAVSQLTNDSGFVTQTALNSDLDQSIVYRGQLSPSDDMHSLTLPGMYYVQRATGFPTNFPDEFHGNFGRILVNKSKSASSHYGETHFVMDSECLWVEQCTGSIWSGWKRVANFSDLDSAVMQRAAVQTDTDLDTLTQSGFYLLYSGHSYDHAPDFYTGGSAWVVVLDFTTTSASAHFRIQLFMRVANKVWAIRTYNTSSGVGSWGAWVTYDDKFYALYGKKVSIVGDSISTYNGYLPSGYAYYYPHGDVNSVSKTWWKTVIDSALMTLVSNASWSGSWVCYDSGGSVSADSAKVAYTDARINALADGDTKPDIVIVLIGTNDFIHNGGNPLGTLDENTELPGETVPITDFRPAYATMINKIRTTYPNAHVYCCTLIQRYRSTDTAYPIKNGNGNALALYNNAIVDVANWMGCNVIRLDSAISLGQVATLTEDGIHPTAEGMALIADEVLRCLVHNEQSYL